MRGRPTGPIAARLLPLAHSFACASFMSDLVDRQARDGTRPEVAGDQGRDRLLGFRQFGARRSRDLEETCDVPPAWKVAYPMHSRRVPRCVSLQSGLLSVAKPNAI